MMSFREIFEKSVDFIDEKRKYIVTASISILGIIALIVVLFASSDELSVGKESSNLIKSIENRKYAIATNYYNDLEKDFSKAKMKRFNKSVSKKLNKVLLTNGDKYISGQIGKEHYSGLINMINSLDEVTVDLKKIIDQAQRVAEMYKEENLTYDIATAYINSASSLNGIGDELNSYKQVIKVINDSRNIYESSVKNQEIKKYHEAIEGYDKVLEEDKKYYNYAQKAKNQCIEDMHEYYIEKSKEVNTLGNYEEALQYIEYLKPYYIDDEEIQKLEKEYKTNLELYTLTAEDILNIIVTKSGKDKDVLSLTSFQQMIDNEKYYYVEVYQYDKLIDELLVEAKTKKIYSYRDSNKDYKVNYSDGYFKVIEDGSIIFAISEGESKFLLENKLSDKNNKYKSISKIDIDKVDSYVDGETNINELLGKAKNSYYYFAINRGLFKKKEMYAVNMYDKKIYSISKDGLSNY
ncbi:MAG: UbiD family decarboxylase [Romboutsia sp.]